MKEKCADYVIGGTNHPFGMTVLWRSVRTRQTESDAVIREEGTEGGGEEFSSVITLEAAYVCVKLSCDEGKESKKCITCIRLSS